MERAWSLRFAEFTPGDVDRITGLGINHQRVWRGRGHLPPSDRPHARFDTLQVAETAVRYELAKRGIPPGQSAAIGKAAALRVLWCALMDVDGVCEVVGEPSAVAQFRDDFGRDETLITQIVGLSLEQQERFVIAIEDDEPALTNDLEMVDMGEQASGFFISLAALAHRFASRAREPLVMIQLVESSSPARKGAGPKRRLMPPRG